MWLAGPYSLNIYKFKNICFVIFIFVMMVPEAGIAKVKIQDTNIQFNYKNRVQSVKDSVIKSQ
jgi:hypothetical protein